MEPVELNMNKLTEDELKDEELKIEDVCGTEVAAAQEAGCHDDVTSVGEQGEQGKESENTRDIREKEEPREKNNRCTQEETVPVPEAGDEAKKEEACPFISGSRQKWVAFTELPWDVVSLARNSVIHPEVIKYYKHFGLNEENIKLIFQMRPSEEVSYKPVDLPPFKGSPKTGG